MKRAILYFTNQDQLVKKLDIFSAPEFNTYVSYRHNDDLIVLVNDKLTLDDFKQETWQPLEALRGFCAYYVYHTNPTTSIREFLDQEPSIRGSEWDLHELIGDFISHYYIKLTPILNDERLSKDIFDACWQQFDKDNLLEEMLDELHEYWQSTNLDDSKMVNTFHIFWKEKTAKLK